MFLKNLSKVALTLLLASRAFAGAGAEEPVRICYFSLNNEKEFVEMQKFTARLNKHSSQRIEVVEFVDESKKMNAEELFTEMCSSGVRCDGLVLSGHHTGSWSGDRASGSLSLEHIEKMACDPRCSNWFTNINALWLQGCETLKDEVVETADARGRRVGAHRRRHSSGDIQDLAQLQREYSATLDKDNPLSSRYMRVAPKATIFGWTAIAPGEKWHSEYSIPYHIAHTIKRLRKQRRATNPVKGDINDREALRYTEVMLAILTAPEGEKGCEEAAIKGWYSHGHAARGEPGFIQPEIAAYGALHSSSNQALLDAKLNQCLFMDPSRADEILVAVDKVLEDEAAIGYNFNGIWGLVQNLRKDLKKPGHLELYTSLMEKLKHPKIKTFMQDNLNDKATATLVKIDYYAFYRDVSETADPDVESKLLAKAEKELLHKPKADEALDTLYFKKSVLDSLIKNGLLSDERAEALLKKLTAKTQDSTSLTAAGWILDHLLKKEPPYDSQKASEYIALIMNRKNAGAYVRFVLADVIGDHWAKLRNPAELFSALLDKAKFDRNGFAAAEFIDAAVAIANRPEAKEIKVESMKKIMILSMDQISYIPASSEREEYLEAKRKIYHSLREKGYIHAGMAQNLLDELTDGQIDSTNAILASGMLDLHYKNAVGENRIKNPEKYIKILTSSSAATPLVQMRLMDLLQDEWSSLENPKGLYFALLKKFKATTSMENAKDYLSAAISIYRDQPASFEGHETISLIRTLRSMAVAQLKVAPRNARDNVPFGEFKTEILSNLQSSGFLTGSGLEDALDSLITSKSDPTTLRAAFEIVEGGVDEVKDLEKRLKGIYNAKQSTAELKRSVLAFVLQNPDRFKRSYTFLGHVSEKELAEAKEE